MCEAVFRERVREKLSESQIESMLQNTPGWAREGESIRRVFAFSDFQRAFSFMSGCALVCEKADHHPDWSNSYNRVDVRFTTHDAGGLTLKDFELARAFNAFLMQKA